MKTEITVTDILLAQLLAATRSPENKKNGWREILRDAIDEAEEFMKGEGKRVAKKSEEERNRRVQETTDAERCQAQVVAKAAADLYSLYPVECRHPKYYRVGKRVEDLEGMKGLIAAHGFQTVKEAIERVISEDNYTPNLSKFIACFDTYKEQAPVKTETCILQSIDWPI